MKEFWDMIQKVSELEVFRALSLFAVLLQTMSALQVVRFAGARTIVLQKPVDNGNNKSTSLIRIFFIKNNALTIVNFTNKRKEGFL